jgi:polyisoprenoid-binding protein YceI
MPQSLLLRTRVVPRPGRYRLARTHCAAEFSVRHMLMKTAHGRFSALGGELVVDGDDPLASWVRVDLDASSLRTGSAERDRVIIGPDFLDAEAHPVIRFESTWVDEIADGRFSVQGDLYVRDKVVEIELDARMVIVAPRRVSFAATGSLSRQAYGLTWNDSIETLGVVVADTVKLHLAGEFTS